MSVFIADPKFPAYGRGMVYLDNNATTPVAPEVVAAMLPCYAENWGNPSSLYPFGSCLGRVLDEARTRLASLIGATRPTEILFTSGGTEANHMAIRGLLQAQPGKRHLITSVIEHSSILNLCKLLEAEGHTVTCLPVSENGQIAIPDLEAAIRPNTALVSLMWANNETGILSPMEKIADICARRGVLLHSDAVQAVGKIPLSLGKIPVHLLSVAAHKVHGPKGSGALYIRRGTPWVSPCPGTQEHGRRAGTENVAGIAGLGVAAGLAQIFLKDGAAAIESLRDQMESRLLRDIPDIAINGRQAPRVGNTSSVNIRGINGESCVMMLAEQGICISTGSACSAGHITASHVLKAMGVDLKQAASIRLSLSRNTTVRDVETLCTVLPEVVVHLRRLSPK